MQITWNRLWNDFATMVFPAPCLLCGGPKAMEERFFCSPCFVDLPRERNFEGCVNATTRRIQGLFPFVQAYSYFKFSKRGHVQKMLHLLKYGRLPQLAFHMGVCFGSEVLCNSTEPFDFIIPVPIHPDKARSRGYNQSLEIARGLAKVLSLEILCCLERRVSAKTQTTLSRWQRFENTANEFSMIKGIELKGSRVLLIDDIITTGATMAGCAQPLLGSGIRDLGIAALGLAQGQ